MENRERAARIADLFVDSFYGNDRIGHVVDARSTPVDASRLARAL
jgi:hypothetical protein